MALKKTADGKVDKRTKEYKEMVERMAKARKAAAKAQAKPIVKKTAAKSTVKKNSDGTVDKRTKEGKAIAERMAKARAAKNSFVNRIKRFFK